MVIIIVTWEKWQTLQITMYIRKQFIRYLKYNIRIIFIISA